MMISKDIESSKLLLLGLLLAVAGTQEAKAQSGIATTTRYWDCSGGACGCGYLGDDGQPAHCFSNAMFVAPNNNQYGAIYYGTAAGSRALFGEGTDGRDFLGPGCGNCYKLTGTSNVNQVGVQNTIVLKIANLCPEGNSVCSGGKVHFDIAAPGFDFAGTSLSNTCNSRNVDEAFGFNLCGNTWPAQDCNCGVFNDPVLEAGCNNFKSLNWDNVQVSYERVVCPAELDRQPCWEDNGRNWPPNNNIPEFCASNLDSNSGPSGPVSPVASPTSFPANPGPSPVAPPTQPTSPSSPGGFAAFIQALIRFFQALFGF